ncbi:MAG: response regulator, partial [Gemmatimonadota bacterium]
ATRQAVSPGDGPDGEALPGEYVRLAVADNGPGMDEETRQHVFEPFFTTKDVGAGTGLGLSTVYGIVRQHEGWVECRSRPQAGAVFALYLPVTAEVAPVPAAPDGGAPSGGRETILVVDDEEAVRRTTARMLEHFGYRVLEAADGEAALALVAQQAPDLVLLDLSMPGMPGPDVQRELRRVAPGVRVVLFTGYAAEGQDAAGADGVIQKPFTAPEMARAVRAALGGKSGTGMPPTV